jgi:hypothetical protein
MRNPIRKGCSGRAAADITWTSCTTTQDSTHHRRRSFVRPDGGSSHTLPTSVQPFCSVWQNKNRPLRSLLRLRSRTYHMPGNQFLTVSVFVPVSAPCVCAHAWMGWTHTSKRQPQSQQHAESAGNTLTHLLDDAHERGHELQQSMRATRAEEAVHIFMGPVEAEV